MRFFNQLEQNHLSNFIKEHRSVSQTYSKPFTRLEFAKFIQEKVSTNSYFFMRGIAALLKAGVSAGKGIYSLLSFSFKDAQLAAQDSGSSLISGVAKISFSVIATCFNLIQFFCKAVSTVFHLLSSECPKKSVRKYSNQKFEMEKFNKEIASLNLKTAEIGAETNTIKDMIDKYEMQLARWENKYFSLDHSLGEEKKAIEKMYRNLKWSLNNYPLFNPIKAFYSTDYIISHHKKLRDYHADVCEFAATFIKEFDTYLRLLDRARNQKEESCPAVSFKLDANYFYPSP